VALFVRRGKKFASLTEAGERILGIAERVLAEAENIRRTGAEYAAGETGVLSIAATHTQARYALPAMLARFRLRHPRMRLRLHQGAPAQVAQMVAHGDATFGLATEALEANASLRTWPAYAWRHCAVVPHGHALARRASVDLETWPRSR
jgi:DNA-binding transcriptional LysR family regulator